ncbi:protein FAM186A isoform X2 [Oryctolagus cuniculus]
MTEIMSNVHRIMARYSLDFDLSSGHRISLTEHMRKQRSLFLERMGTYSKNAENREKILAYILAWLEEWNVILSEITAFDVEEHYHWIVQMEMFPETLRAIENNVNILCSISTTFLNDKKTQKKKTVSRGALWKTWKDRFIKRPATALALRPDQMISDQFTTNTKVLEIQRMLQELIGSSMFNKMENTAIKYISATILNLYKALSAVCEQVNVSNIVSDSMFFEKYETEKELSRRMICDLSEQNELLQRKLQEREETYEQLIQSTVRAGQQEYTSVPTSRTHIKAGDIADSMHNILAMELENTLYKSPTKNIKSSEIKWGSSLKAPAVLTPDLPGQQYRPPEDHQQMGPGPLKGTADLKTLEPTKQQKVVSEENEAKLSQGLKRERQLELNTNAAPPFTESSQPGAPPVYPQPHPKYKPLTPLKTQALMTTLTPQQAEALGTTLTPQQAQALMTTLTTQQAQALGTTLTTQQAEALRTTLTPQQAQTLGTTLTPTKAKAIRPLTPQLAQDVETMTPQLAQALGKTLTPQQAQVLGTTLTHQQAQALGTTVTHQKAQALGTSLTLQQAQAVGTTLTHQQDEGMGTTLTPQQAQAVGTTLTPQQAQAVGTTLTHQQDQGMGTTLTTQQAQAGGTTLTHQQAQAVGTTLTNQQAQALGTTLTLQQAQARGTTLTDQQAQALGTSLTNQQGQDMGTTLTHLQAQAVGTTLTNQQAQAVGTTLTLQQAQAWGTTLTDQQAQALGTTLTNQQGMGMGTTLTHLQAQAVGTTLTNQQAQGMGTTLTHQQALALRTTLAPHHTQTQGAHLTPDTAPPTPGQPLELEAVRPKQDFPQTAWPPPAMKAPLTPRWPIRSGTTSTSTKSPGLHGPLSPGQSLAPGPPSFPGALLESGPSSAQPPAHQPPVSTGQPPSLQAPSALAQHLAPPTLPGETSSWIAPGSAHPSTSWTPSAAGMPQKGVASSGRKKGLVRIASQKLVQPSPLGWKRDLTPFIASKPSAETQTPRQSSPMEPQSHLSSNSTPTSCITYTDGGTLHSLQKPKTSLPSLAPQLTPASQVPFTNEGVLHTRQKPRTSLPSATPQISRTSQKPLSQWASKSQHPSLDTPRFMKPASDINKDKMMVPPSSPKELEGRMYFVDVKAQRKNLMLLNQALTTNGLPSPLHTTARNLIIETLHTDQVRLGYLFHKYTAHRLIQRFRNYIICRVKATRNTGKGYEMQKLYVMMSKIDGYQKRAMHVWTEKQKLLEEKRNQCLRKMIALFGQLQETYKLNLSRPIPLHIHKKILSSREFVQQTFQQQTFQQPPAEEDMQPVKNIRHQDDQMDAIWKTDICDSSYPITEKTPTNVPWDQLGGYPDIPRLLELDIQSTFRKSLTSIKTRIRKTPK